MKNGEREAQLEITLSSGSPSKRPVVISRRIVLVSGEKAPRSDWSLNGTSCPQKDITEAVEKLNVQLDNLCQFLPQDRVVAFAQLSPKDLLVETEKALGDAELHRQHAELVNSKAEIADLEKEVAAEEGRLERLHGDKEALERDVEKFKQRQALLEQAKRLKMKLPWVVFDEALALSQKSKEAFTASAASLKAKEQALSEFSGPLKEKEKAEKEMKGRHQAAKEALLRSHSAVDTSIEEFEAAGTELKNEEDALASASRRVASGRKKREELEAKVAKAQADLDAFPAVPIGVPPKVLADLKARVRAASDEAQEAEAQRHEVREAMRLPEARRVAAAEKLSTFNTVRSQRIQALSSKHHSLPEVLKVIEQLRVERKFEKEVFAPLACHVSVDNRDAANYLESQLEQHLWSAVVLQSDADAHLLAREIKARLGAGADKLSLLTWHGDQEARVHVNDPQLAALGIKGMLDEFVDAPPAVRGILCNFGGLHRAFVGDKRADAHADELCARGIPILWTPSNQYTSSKSRYGDQITTRMRPTRGARILVQAAANEGERRALQEQVAAAERELGEANARAAALTAQMDERNRVAGDLRQQYTDAVHAQAQHAARKEKLARAVHAATSILSAHPSDESAAKEVTKAQARLDKALRKHGEAGVRLAKTHVAEAEAVLRWAPLQLGWAEVKEQVRACTAQLAEESGAVAEAKKRHAQITAIRDSEKAEARRLHALAQAAAPLEGNDELKAAFEDMPSTTEELEKEIAEVEDSADAIMCPNPAVMAQYNRINEELRALEKEHGGNRKKLDGKLAAIAAVKAAWLPALRNLFDRINGAFSASFAAIGCAGEVRLVEKEDDFGEYCVDLMVKFRAAEQLQKLTANRQSGGERSVSTMLYLIALQDLTRCPFRVVDEINQGMDEVNERKIFKQMVASACAPGTPQCFLLTPKLLPQLDYTDEVTVLAIFNGPWIQAGAGAAFQARVSRPAAPLGGAAAAAAMDEDEDED